LGEKKRPECWSLSRSSCWIQELYAVLFYVIHWKVFYIPVRKETWMNACLSGGDKSIETFQVIF